MKNHAFFVLFVLGTFGLNDGFAGVSSLNTSTAIRPVSQYGIIQNVQDYSMNPFWNSNSPYNQNFPQPVYVTGPELNTGDCQSAVSSLISSYCFANNNCRDKRISDVRPVIMLQLSRMPGHNYASNCSGFIDSEFDSFVATYSAAIPASASFPGAIDTNPNYNAAEFKLENPYERKDGTWQGDEWQKEKKERSQELKDLQSMNNSGAEKLAKSDFPTTFSDLSFAERMEITQQGYEPFESGSAYRSIKIEDENTYQARLQNSYNAAWCKENPKECQQSQSASERPNGTTYANSDFRTKNIVDRLIEALSK